ncbi:MAG TPA: isochorismatase family cysteine hydrolase [Ktedonobacterales bacterium]|nr:isochorismatase family cysteine hydrolase [Ktedonobacterales bacterium]
MQTLIVLDAQNEFSAEGNRTVPNHAEALEAIRRRVEEARREGRPIAWVRHHNPPVEPPPGLKPAFIPGTWGAELSSGLGPLAERSEEVEFVKNVFGAFTGTDIGSWLEEQGSDDVLLVGFFAHMCVSTTAREALMRGLSVSIDPDGTGGFPWRHELLGEQSAEEVHRTALLQLSHLGVSITPLHRAS